MVVVRIGRKRDELQRRILSVTGPAQGVVTAQRITRFGAGERRGWKDRAAGLFGFTMAKSDLYPVRWYWVVGAALLIGRIAVALTVPLVGSIAWVAMPLVAILLSRVFFSQCDGKRKLLLRQQLPDALSLIVRAVRVGIPVTEALRAVSRESSAPTGNEFKQLADPIAIGVALDVALREMAVRNDLPEYGFFAAAVGLQAQTGGGLTDTLELLADVTRKRVALRARGRALSAEARTSAIVLSGLPLVMLAGLSLISADFVAIMFYTSTGHMLLGTAALLLAIGGGSVQIIIQKALS